ncbi:MAG: DUF4920 domain-containing protein [Flavobacteriaceae bacterium]|nr:DUF4920 domain-containing protein [Flavobacteriaceae bacterium]
MKNIVVLLMLFTAIFGCKNHEKEVVETKEIQSSEQNEVKYASFGDKIEADGAITSAEMAERYQKLKEGDTLKTKVKGTILEVCSKKGCWMMLDLGKNKEMMVRFKDYGFFMPLNAKGEVIVDGKAYVTVISVDELRHYAEDAGKPKKAIEAITEPETTLAFEATGVLLKG